MSYSKKKMNSRINRRQRRTGGASMNSARYRSIAAARALPRQIIQYQQTHSGGEVKSIDVINPTNAAAQAQFTLNSTPQITALNLLSAGSSMFNRLGRKVSLKSVHLQGFFNWSNASMPGGQFARLIIVYDKQPNGALPVFSDIFKDQDASTGADHATTQPTSGVNLSNRDRFEIIADRRFFLPAQATIAGDVSTSATVDPMHCEIFHKLKNRETHYKADSTVPVIGDIATGSLLFVTVGNIASGSEAWALLASIRVRYTDL